MKKASVRTEAFKSVGDEGFELLRKNPCHCYIFKSSYFLCHELSTIKVKIISLNCLQY